MVIGSKDWARPCPVCQAPIGRHCVSASGKRTTTHLGRIAPPSRRNVLRPRKPA